MKIMYKEINKVLKQLCLGKQEVPVMLKPLSFLNRGHCNEPAASRRIDRQLEGRCARQGDPGSVLGCWIRPRDPEAAGAAAVHALGAACWGG